MEVNRGYRYCHTPLYFETEQMRMLIHHNENELIVSLRQGDMKAFEELYFRYVPRLMAFAKTYVMDEQLAEEAVQEIFIKIWEKRKSLDESRNFKSYLFQSVKNHLFNLIRNKKNACQLEDIPEEMLAEKENVTENLSYLELEEIAFKLIANLPKVQQEVFTLSRIEGMSNAEIASKLNLSKRTVEHHIYLSVKFLKGKLIHNTSRYVIFLTLFYC